MRFAKRFSLIVMTIEAFLSLAGAVYWFRRNRKLLWLSALTIIYFVGVSAGAETYSRFRVPIMPIYATLVAGGVYLLGSRLNHRKATPQGQIFD
jgi:hypothetical protein